VPHVLDVQITLDHRLGQVTEGGRCHGRRAQDQALPDMAAQQLGHHDAAAGQAEDDGAGQALPGLLRADDRGHQVLAQQDARRVAAGVAADGQDNEDQGAPRSVRLQQHQRDEHRHQREVSDGEEAGGHVPDIASCAAAQPPRQYRDGRQRERAECPLRLFPVGQRDHGDAADRDGDQRQADLFGAERVPELPEARSGEDPHVEQKRRLDREQREQHQAAQTQANGERGRQVTPGADTAPPGLRGRPAGTPRFLVFKPQARPREARFPCS
jgi:hypothetical protein